MKLLPLTKGLFARVSDEDFERAAAYKWTATCNPNGRRQGGREKWYAVRRGRAGEPARVYLHRWLVGAPRGMVVDHLDGDGLHCERPNLLLTTQRENTQQHRRKMSEAKEPCL